MEFKRTLMLTTAALSVCSLLVSGVPQAFAHNGEIHETSADEETHSSIALTGQLIELSSTDLPTTIVVRQNPGGAFTDYTVEIPEDVQLTPNTFTMSDWITGDFLALKGELNENTGIVTASLVQNVSLNPFQHQALNGWVTSTDEAASTITVTWDGKEHIVPVTADTRMVVPPINPAKLSDFEKNDRVRLRLDRSGTALIIVALRRGDEIFLKARTRGFHGEVVTIDDTGSSITVRLNANPGLRPSDVNNLVGVEGELVTVETDEHTKFVRRYNGTTSLEEIMAGDKVFVVGRVDDNGTILARMVKDESIFRLNVSRHIGQVTDVDTNGNKFTVVLLAKEQPTVQAQSTRDELRERVVERVVKTRAIASRISAGVTWMVTYDGATVMKKDGKDATEDDIAVGDMVRVEGVANAQLHIVTAQRIALQSEGFRPLVRVRALRDIVSDRIRTSVGKRTADDIVSEQEDVDATEPEDEQEEELEVEVENELEHSEEQEEEDDHEDEEEHEHEEETDSADEDAS